MFQLVQICPGDSHLPLGGTRGARRQKPGESMQLERDEHLITDNVSWLGSACGVVAFQPGIMASYSPEEASGQSGCHHTCATNKPTVRPDFGDELTHRPK
jgi:hypothetical protein